MKKPFLAFFSILISGCATQSVDYTNYPYSPPPQPVMQPQEEAHQELDRKLTAIEDKTSSIEQGLSDLEKIEGKKSSEPDKYYPSGTSSRLYRQILSN